GLDRRQLGLVLGRSELRDRDGGQDADDHDHDQQLDEGETLAILDQHVAVLLKRCGKFRVRAASHTPLGWLVSPPSGMTEGNWSAKAPSWWLNYCRITISRIGTRAEPDRAMPAPPGRLQRGIPATPPGDPPVRLIPHLGRRCDAAC